MYVIVCYLLYEPFGDLTPHRLSPARSAQSEYTHFARSIRFRGFLQFVRVIEIMGLEFPDISVQFQVGHLKADPSKRAQTPRIRQVIFTLMLVKQ